jgi:hypothetical protein
MQPALDLGLFPYLIDHFEIRAFTDAVVVSDAAVASEWP